MKLSDIEELCKKHDLEWLADIYRKNQNLLREIEKKERNNDTKDDY